MIADGAEEFAGNSENIHKVKKCLEKGVNKILVSENAIQKLNLRKALLIKLKGKVQSACDFGNNNFSPYFFLTFFKRNSFIFSCEMSFIWMISFPL